MKAVLCKSFGPPENLTLEEVDTPSIGAGGVLIDIYSAALGFSDTLQIQGNYQSKPPFPFTPGSEVAGIVADVGSDVTSFKPGDRVLAMVGIGGMAEQVAAPSEAVLHIPDTMDFHAACGFMMIYGTSYHAFKQRAELQPGEDLLVTGAGGGLGITAVELGKVMGARVIAAASTDEKLAAAKEAGADELINYNDGELKEKVKALTGGNGADVIYDPVGGDIFDQCARCINWKGRILVIGFSSGRIPEYKTNLALLKGCQRVGVYWGPFRKREPELCEQNTAELFQLYEQGKIKPLVSKVFPMGDYAAALNHLVNRKAIGKIVMRTRA